MRSLWLTSFVIALIPLACSIDFDRYEFAGGDASATGGASGSGGSAGSSETGGSSGAGGVAGSAAGAASGGDARGDGESDAAGDGASDADAGCGPGTKPCGGSCVSVDDPAYGCGLESCEPCQPLGNALCEDGACTPERCPSGLGECDGDPSVYCETDLLNDLENCGGCGRACSGASVAARICTNGSCTSSCDLGFGNCTRPAAPTADDGCELRVATDSTDCGGCGNSCSAQSLGGGGLVCGQPAANRCGCDGNSSRCRQGTSGGTCDAASDRCICSSTTCRLGEACRREGGADVCSCNGNAPCGGAATVVCCYDPAGCFNLATDPANCGACGRGCAPGFGCGAGQCRCTAAGQCNAGTPGTCATNGRCVCGGITCGQGERCLPSSVCG